MLVTANNKVLINDLGQVLKKYEIPKIVITTRRPTFPNYLGTPHLLGIFRFTTSQLNTIYIDWGDGSEIYEREFTGNVNLGGATAIHTYTDGITEHKISIWFKFPSKITQFTSNLVEWYGEFPKAISLYNLDLLNISRTNNITEFPLDFGAGIFRYLSFSDVTSTSINYIPLWITKSRINRLDIGGRFILSNSSISNVDKLINIQGLNSLSFLGYNSLSDIASNFKDINTLRYLCIGGDNPTTSITTNINACKQITHLGFSYISHSNFGSSVAYGQLNSWGVGLVGMNNLQWLGFSACANAPTDAIVGLSDATNLKTIYARSSYNTTARMDTFITNLYTSVISIASMINANTIMRQVRAELCWVSSGNPTVRPTGTYQAPTGYVQGSSNGSPASPMEMIYVLVKQYRWTILVQNVNNNGIETLTP